MREWPPLFAPLRHAETKVQRTALFQNDGVTFDDVPSVDEVAARWGEITDLSAAKAASFALG